MVAQALGALLLTLIGCGVFIESRRMQVATVVARGRMQVTGALVGDDRQGLKTGAGRGGV